jgi:hypothetical protein
MLGFVAETGSAGAATAAGPLDADLTFTLGFTGGVKTCGSTSVTVVSVGVDTVVSVLVVVTVVVVSGVVGVVSV